MRGRRLKPSPVLNTRIHQSRIGQSRLLLSDPWFDIALDEWEEQAEYAADNSILTIYCCQVFTANFLEAPQSIIATAQPNSRAEPQSRRDFLVFAVFTIR